jgi:hypothetical protein
VLNDKQREALFLAVHREIEAAATKAARVIAGRSPGGDLAYPPNGGLTAAEGGALASVSLVPEAEAAVRKVVADAAAAPLFSLLSLLDGVTDPEGFEGPWGAFHVAPATDTEYESLMLHDVFFDTYWLWRDRRPDPGWSLDTHPDAQAPDQGPPASG